MLFTVDEVDPTLDEMVQLAAFYQHFVREGRKVALLMAGLPHNISSLLNNKTVSFLRRSNRRALDRIPDGEVSAALVRTAQAGNRNVDAAALTAATESIGGFPFMLQLVGYYAWDENPRASTLDSADFARGIAIAQQEMTYRILDATFAELSPGDLRFAAAMLEDEGDSRIADLVEYLVLSIVDDADAVSLEVIDGDNASVIEITVSEPDVAKVIGRHGRTIKAIRTLARALAARLGTSVEVEVLG